MSISAPPPPNAAPPAGEVIAERKFEVLLEAAWLPAPLGRYEDRPASPERLAGARDAAGGGAGAAAGGAAGASSSPAKPAAYRCGPQTLHPTP